MKSSSNPRSRGLNVPAVFLAYGHGRARGVEPQGLTDPPMMGWDTRKLRALWLL
jgi:hypothetical protein